MSESVAWATTHARLVARQSTTELERKAGKAARRQRIWTQEDFDAAERVATELCERLQWD